MDVTAAWRTAFVRDVSPANRLSASLTTPGPTATDGRALQSWKARPDTVVATGVPSLVPKPTESGEASRVQFWKA